MKKLLLILLCLPLIGFGQTKTHEEMMKSLKPLFNEISLEKKRSNYECLYGDCQNGYGIQAYWGWKYVGQFKGGDKFGKGYVESQGGSFTEGEGEWFPMTGYFKSTNRDGDIYEGEYWNGYKHGKGKLTYTDGTIKKGYWEKEKFIGKFKDVNDCTELPLSDSELRKKFPKGVCGYYDKDDNMLFEGGHFDINHEDVSKVAFYECTLFSGELFNSSCYIQTFEADRFGNNKKPLRVLLRDKDRFNLCEAEYNSDGTITKYTYE